MEKGFNLLEIISGQFKSASIELFLADDLF
jgi:hypothetical protein